MKLNLITSLIILLLFSGCGRGEYAWDYKATQLDVDYGLAYKQGERIESASKWYNYRRSPKGWLDIRLKDLARSHREGWISQEMYKQRVNEAYQKTKDSEARLAQQAQRERAKQERKDRAWENAGTDGINWANQYMNSRARGYNPAASAIRAQNTMPRY